MDATDTHRAAELLARSCGVETRVDVARAIEPLQERHRFVIEGLLPRTPIDVRAELLRIHFTALLRSTACSQIPLELPLALTYTVHGSEHDEHRARVWHGFFSARHVGLARVFVRVAVVDHDLRALTQQFDGLAHHVVQRFVGVVIFGTDPRMCLRIFLVVKTCLSLQDRQQ